MSFPVDSIGRQQVKRAVLFVYFHSTYCLEKRNNTLKGKTLKVYPCAIVLVASVYEIVSKLQKYQIPFLQNCSLVTCRQIRCEVVVTRIVLFVLLFLFEVSGKLLT